MEKCDKCGGDCKYYDTVKRGVLYGGGVKRIAYVKRVKCLTCGSIKRVLPSYILPCVHYCKDVVDGCVNGTIGPWLVEYEDRPCDISVKRWKTRFLHA